MLKPNNAQCTHTNPSTRHLTTTTRINRNPWKQWKINRGKISISIQYNKTTIKCCSTHTRTHTLSVRMGAYERERVLFTGIPIKKMNNNDASIVVHAVRTHIPFSKYLWWIHVVVTLGRVSASASVCLPVYVCQQAAPETPVNVCLYGKIM